MPIVRAVSTRLAAELPSSVDVEDLVSAGTFGLMDALDRYDPSLGARFETYCVLRIRGAILDELRQLNWMPRMQTARVAKVGAAREALKGELGRQPTAHEVARRTGLKVREVENVPTNGRQPVSLTAGTAPGTEGAPRGVDVIKEERTADPATAAQEKERRDILAKEVRKLPKPERLLVMLYYFEGLTMRQIGEVLNVTESRVCQMHAGILARLQQRLVELDEAERRGG